MSKKEKSLQPGLIVFIGEVGNAVYQAFLHRSSERIPAPLEYLQKPYFNDIAFVRPEGVNASYSYHFANVDAAIESGSLEEMLDYMMNVSVLDAQVSNDTGKSSETGEDSETADASITTQKNKALNNAPFISIVGHVRDPELYLAVTRVGAKDASWKINCLCCCYPLEFDRHNTDANSPTPSAASIPSDLAKWVNDMKLEFCSLFEDDAEGVVAREDHAVVHYAVALALLTLLIMGGENPGTQSKIGTISTCLISVPREIILHACCLQVSAFILESWLAENEKVREDAKAYQEIQKCVDDDMAVLTQLTREVQKELPGANKQHTIAWWWNIFRKKKGIATKQYTWTLFAPVGNEQNAQSAEYTALANATEKLFHHTMFDNALPSQGWLEKLDRKHSFVRDTELPEWKQHVDAYWQRQAQTTKECLDGAFRNLAEKNWNGGQIIAYADLLAEKLQQLQQERMHAQKTSAPEEDLASDAYKGLSDMLILDNQKMPTKSTWGVLALLATMAFFVFSFLLLNISLPLLAVRWQAWLIALLLPFVGIVLGNWYLLAGFYRPSFYTKSDILLYYRSIIAARCKQESQKKSALILESIRSSLDFMTRENIKECKDYLEENARRSIASLFENVEASHTVYVGNKILFSQNEEFASYTFLKAMKGREGRYEAAAQQMFQMMNRSPHFASGATFALIDDSLNFPPIFEQKEAFRKRLNALVELSLKFNTIKDLYNVSAIDPQVSKIWDEIARRLNLKLWSQQGEMKDTHPLLLCGTDEMLTKMRTGAAGVLKQKRQEISTTDLFSAEKPTLLDEQEEQSWSSEPVISEWFLVAVFNA